MNQIVASALVIGLAASAGAEAGPKRYTLKAGQELTFAATVADGKVTLGVPRLTRLGAARPRNGEITVGVTPRDKDFYSQVLVTEKTSAPIDFVATGQIGDIKIDERVICGRIDQPVSQRIGGVSWSVALHEFAVGKGTGDCQ